MGVTAIVAATLISTGVSVYQSNRAEKAQEKAAAQQRKSMLSMDDGQAPALAARDEQRRRAAAAQGRSDTIKTGQLGVTDPPPGTQKSLLGR